MFFLFLFSDNLRSTGVDFSFESLLEFSSKSIWAWGSFYLDNLNESFSFTSGINLFKLLLWFWFNFDKWWPSRELSISLIFSNLVENKFLKFIIMILWILSVKLNSLIHCIFSLSLVISWHLFHFPLVSSFCSSLQICLLLWDLSVFFFFFNVGTSCY